MIPSPTGGPRQSERCADLLLSLWSRAGRRPMLPAAGSCREKDPRFGLWHL